MATPKLSLSGLSDSVVASLAIAAAAAILAPVLLVAVVPFAG